MKLGKKLVSLVFLITVFCVFVSIDLFHTERPGDGENPSCPACLFHHSGVADHDLDVIQPPGLTFVGFLEQVQVVKGQTSLPRVAAARSPPS